MITFLLVFFISPALAVDRYAMINDAYKASVKPILQKKCFDCHSDQTHYPWYYKLPFVKNLIDEDIEEAIEHLDMSHDFPFQSKKMDFEEYMDELKEVVEKNEMPPIQYKLMHWSSSLSKSDSDIILKWVDYSVGLFKKDKLQKPKTKQKSERKAD
jgi:cytochrome c peroxidase